MLMAFWEDSVFKWEQRFNGKSTSTRKIGGADRQ
jgi:hypothetical protein